MSKEAKFPLSEYVKATFAIGVKNVLFLMSVSSSFYKGNAMMRYSIPLNAENTIKSC